MTPWVLRLVIANVVAYLATMLLPGLLPALWLVPAHLPFRPWTGVSYMFLHGGLMHLFFNMLGLFFFGPRVELRLGGARFLALYFVSGLAGGLLSLVFAPFTPIIGASGAVFGVQLGFARYWPRERLAIYGIIPIEARWMVVLLTGLSLYGGFGGGGGNIAHFAHLGGFLGGYLYLRWAERHSPARAFEARVHPSRGSGGSGRQLERWSRIPRDSLHEVNREELDRLLGKIQQSGVTSLTPDEVAFLDRCSER